MTRVRAHHRRLARRGQRFDIFDVMRRERLRQILGARIDAAGTEAERLRLQADLDLVEVASVGTVLRMFEAYIPSVREGRE